MSTVARWGRWIASCFPAWLALPRRAAVTTNNHEQSEQQ